MKQDYVTLFAAAQRSWVKKEEEMMMWISPSAPRCSCFDSNIINRQHNTDPAAASVWEVEKLEHWLDFPAPAPADATDVRGNQSTGRLGRCVLWRAWSVFSASDHHHLPFTNACMFYRLINKKGAWILEILRSWVQVPSKEGLWVNGAPNDPPVHTLSVPCVSICLELEQLIKESISR